MKAKRYNEWKLKWSFIYIPFIEVTIQVLMFGAGKYGANNWKKWMRKSDILDSMQRHISYLWQWVEYDDESKLHHIGHLTCNAMFYYYFFITDTFIQEESTDICKKDDKEV